MNSKPISCPKCGLRISVPKVDGTIHVTCPKCRTEWDWPEKSRILTNIKKFRSINFKELYRGIPRRQLAVIKIFGVIALCLFLVGSVYKIAKHVHDRGEMEVASADTNPPAAAPLIDGAAIKPPVDLTNNTAIIIPENPLPAPLPGKATSPQQAPRPKWDGASEVALPKTGDGAFFFDAATANSTVKFTPRTEQENVVIKFLNATNLQLACWVFVRQGESAQIQIPPGVYKCRIAGGSRWYGEKNLLGPYASYTIIPNVVIPYGSTYTIDCRPGLNESLHEVPMDAKDF